MAKTKPKAKLTAGERAAMKEALAERKGANGERELLAKIAEMPDAERAIAEQLHALITETAPELAARTWYGMPAWAKDGDVVCFFQNATKFKTRYSTLGFSDKAMLDDGAMWPTAYALSKLGTAERSKVAALIKKATG